MTPSSLTNLREEMLAVARGERAAPPRPAAPLMAALSPGALDLLGVILRERPDSMSALVALTGRAQSNVSRSLKQLAAYGLVQFVREGREVRPRPVVGAVVLDLATGTYETRLAAV